MFKSATGAKIATLSVYLLAAGCVLPQVGSSQSLNPKAPAPLKVGSNRATIDSFGTEQFWGFTAEPGHFQVVFTRQGPQEGFSVGAKAGVGAVLAPKTPGSTLTQRDTQNGSTFEGNCTVPTRVVLMVEPAKSPLVRQTNEYTLDVTGTIASGGSGAEGGASSSAPSVVGVYNCGVNDYGAAKFITDGTIVCTSGAKGTWELFDQDTRTYIVKINDSKWTLTFQPGRGFVDSNNILVLQAKRTM